MKRQLDKVAKRFFKMKRLRERLSGEQNHRCCYCGIRTSLKSIHKNEPYAATIEHVRAIAMGGNNNWRNVVMACRRCNNTRKTLDAYVFNELKLWLYPAIQCKLFMMAQIFKQEPANIGLLRAMAYCCPRCEDNHEGK